MMKLSIIALMLIFSITSFGQEFSGNWEFEASKSKVNAEFSMSPKKIEITQNKVEMTVVKHSEFQYNEINTTSKYTLDGKECINAGWRDTKVKSKAVWSDDKKSLIITSIFEMMDGNSMEVVETYFLNGKDLNIKMNAESPFGDIDEVWSYEKK